MLLEDAAGEVKGELTLGDEVVELADDEELMLGEVMVELADDDKELETVVLGGDVGLAGEELE